jgi:hypothetical protein
MTELGRRIEMEDLVRALDAALDETPGVSDENRRMSCGGVATDATNGFAVRALAALRVSRTEPLVSRARTDVVPPLLLREAAVDDPACLPGQICEREVRERNRTGAHGCGGGRPPWGRV